MIVIIALIILIILLYILINYLKKRETFMTIYDDINDYLKNNTDNNILRDSYCFDNDGLLGEIKNDKTLTCASHYANVSDIYYKGEGTIDNTNDSFYDSKKDKYYSFAELCPVTTGQINSTLCLRKHNNEITDTIFRLNNVVTDSEIKISNDIVNIDNELIKYRNDKYRLFNSSEIQDYIANN